MQNSYHEFYNNDFLLTTCSFAKFHHSALIITTHRIFYLFPILLLHVVKIHMQLIKCSHVQIFTMTGSLEVMH